MHFRFWTETQVIDIWTNDFINFNGQLINFTTSVKSKNNHEVFYSEIVAFKQSKTDSIYRAFDENSIFKIPNQEDIPGWKSGLDGSIYLIEYSSKNEYSFKSYWTPTSFLEIKEAGVLQSLITYLFSNLTLESSWYSFVKTLPKSCYKAGGTSMICPKLSKKAIKRIYYNN
ncbi:MAG: hypothetical protein HYZ42_18260 [Bacteroidetes bacterium]|nr:hypothetical protein [Bacteroidota bacterium]